MGLERRELVEPGADQNRGADQPIATCQPIGPLDQGPQAMIAGMGDDAEKRSDGEVAKDQKGDEERAIRAAAGDGVEQGE